MPIQSKILWRLLGYFSEVEVGIGGYVPVNFGGDCSLSQVKVFFLHALFEMSLTQQGQNYIQDIAKQCIRGTFIKLETVLLRVSVIVLCLCFCHHHQS